MNETGTLNSSIKNGIATIIFGHPKGNSLPGKLLQGIAGEIDKFGAALDVKLIVLQSEGDKTFCGGASFDEFKAAKDLAGAKEFFSGFARVILAIKRAPKFVLARVQGKAVGGGVGVVAAADYALATESASVRLSELAIGIGPFIIGPAVERKIGVAAFGAMAIDADWRDAAWAKNHGLYTEVYPSIEKLDEGVLAFTNKLSGFSQDAMARLKRVLWEGTDHWGDLLIKRVVFTSELSLTDYVQKAISS